MIASKLINSGKKLSSKKILEDIGVYEDISGTEAVIDGRYEQSANYDVANVGVDIILDDDDDDDDDDDEEEDEGSGAVNRSQNNAKNNLLAIDIHELLKTATSASNQGKKPEKQIVDMSSFEDMPTYIDMNLKKGALTDEGIMKITSVDKLMEKSVIKPGFEKQHAIPYETSEKRLRLERKKQRERTKGAKWFNMPAPEMTEEAKNDLMILQMRSALDPKHFYKKNDLSVLPKYFQIGKVVDAPEDFYSSRIPKKARKKTIVDELLADAEFKKYNKRRYLEIIEQKKRTHHKAHKQALRLKRKGKKK